MTEQNNKAGDSSQSHQLVETDSHQLVETDPHIVNADYSPVNFDQFDTKVCSSQAGNSEFAVRRTLKNYSIQLVGLIDVERDLGSLERSLSMDDDSSARLLEVVHQRQDNREKIELLFAELSRKMWKGQLPPTTVAIVERHYKELTDRLLNEELEDEQWSAYFSAFQLSIDILNGKTSLS